MPAMVGIKEAVQIAKNFVAMLYGETLPPNFLLEEVEISPDDKEWLITFGFDIYENRNTTASLINPPLPRRAFKVIRINAATGEPISMKIR